jgi:hypothetical protein
VEWVHLAQCRDYWNDFLNIATNIAAAQREEIYWMFQLIMEPRKGFPAHEMKSYHDCLTLWNE